METRRLNFSSIDGMDDRDFNLDQQKVKQLVNLKKDKDGWRIRDSLKEIVSGLNASQEVTAIIDQQDKVYVSIGTNINIYSVSGDTLNNLLDSINLGFNHKLYSTPRPDVFICVDTDNHKTYSLKFTDRIMALVDLSTVDPSNEKYQALDDNESFLMHEYEIGTGETTWVGMCKHNHYDQVTASSLISPTDVTVSSYETSAYGSVAAGAYIKITSLPTLFTTADLAVGYQVAITTDSAGVQNRTIVEIINSTDFVVNTAVNITTNKDIDFKRTMYNYDANTGSSFGDNTTPGINNYCVNYDTEGTTNATKWNHVALVKLSDQYSSNFRYVLVCGLTIATSGAKAKETDVYLFPMNEDKPVYWEKKIRLGAGKNVFCDDGTGAVNINAKFMDGLQTIAGINDESKLTNITYNISDTIYDTVDYLSADKMYVAAGNKLYYRRYSEVAYTEIPTTLIGDNHITTMDLYLNGTATLLMGLNNGTILKMDVSTDIIEVIDDQPVSTNVYKIFCPYLQPYVLISTGSSVYKYEENLGIFTITYEYIMPVDSYTSQRENCVAIAVSGLYIYFGAGIDVYWALDTGSDPVVYGNLPNTFFVLGLVELAGIIYCIKDCSINNTISFFYSTAESESWTYGDNNINGANLLSRPVHISADNAFIYLLLENGNIKYLPYLLATKWIDYWNFTTTDLTPLKFSPDAVSSGQYKGAYRVTTTKIERLNKIISYTNSFTLYIPNGDKIATLAYNSGTDALTYNASAISAPNATDTTCYSLHTTTAFYYNGTYARYIISVWGGNVYIYLVDKTTTYESGTAGNYLTNTSSYRNQTTYRFIGSALIANKYYANSTGYIGNNLFYVYNDAGGSYTKIDNILIIFGGVSSTATITVQSVGYPIVGNDIISPATGMYYKVSANKLASIESDNIHNVYIAYNNSTSNLIKSYRMTGTSYINSDIGETQTFVASELSPYTDPRGIIGDFVVSNTQGYILTEINRSVKLPVRPLFELDSGDSTLYSAFETGKTPPLYYDCWNIYNADYQTKSGTAYFRTPIDPGYGSRQYVKNVAATPTIEHKYWAFGLLRSYMDEIGFPNITIGRANPNDGYKLYQWAQSKDDIITTRAIDTALPHPFSNISNVSNHLDNSATDDTQNWMLYEYVFYRKGLAIRDRFTADRGFTQVGNELFEAQDVAFSTSNQMYLLDYEGKRVCYSPAYNFVNLGTAVYFDSKPTAITECSNGVLYLTTEREINRITDSVVQEPTFETMTKNMGLEKGNYKSLVSNGQTAFMYNKLGVYWLNGLQLVDCTPPIDSLIYRRDSGNTLGIDVNAGLLYVPLSNVDDLTVVLKDTDYGRTEGNLTYSKAYGVFDYVNQLYRIYSYQDDTNQTDLAMGNFKQFLVLRNGGSLIIPEYSVAVGTENPLCRIVFKKITFGDVFAYKKMRNFSVQFNRNENLEWLRYGIDYVKFEVTRDSGVDQRAWKYGDFNDTTYSDATRYHVSPQSLTNGFVNVKIPTDLDFHDIVINLEFGRLNTTAGQIADVTVREARMDIIDKGRERNGIF